MTYTIMEYQGKYFVSRQIQPSNLFSIIRHRYFTGIFKKCIKLNTSDFKTRANDPRAFYPFFLFDTIDPRRSCLCVLCHPVSFHKIEERYFTTVSNFIINIQHGLSQDRSYLLAPLHPERGKEGEAILKIKDSLLHRQKWEKTYLDARLF